MRKYPNEWNKYDFIKVSKRGTSNWKQLRLHYAKTVDEKKSTGNEPDQGESRRRKVKTRARWEWHLRLAHGHLNLGGESYARQV